MTQEEARKAADDAMERLVKELEAGNDQALTDYLAVQARFHHYSFGNVLLILWQRPEATRVAGFHTWKRLGRFVKKGERGIAILAPMMIRPREEAEAASESAPKPILRFRVVHVFDVSQTDGTPLPEPPSANGDPGDQIPQLRLHIADRGIVLDSEDVPAGAEGISRDGRISIRPDLSPAAEFSVLVHELAHELLHKGEDRPRSRSFREVEAEAVAFVVSHAIGLDVAKASALYIRLYDGTVESLRRSLDRIQRTAAEIIAALDTGCESDPEMPPPALVTLEQRERHR